MGMNIDEAIKQLDKYTIPCGRYKEAYDFAIDTMRKYQKIEEIIKQYKKFGNIDFSMQIISGVVEDGKID